MYYSVKLQRWKYKENLPNVKTSGESTFQYYFNMRFLFVSFMSWVFFLSFTCGFSWLRCFVKTMSIAVNCEMSTFDQRRFLCLLCAALGDCCCGIHHGWWKNGWWDDNGQLECFFSTLPVCRGYNGLDSHCCYWFLSEIPGHRAPGSLYWAWRGLKSRMCSFPLLCLRSLTLF